MKKKYIVIAEIAMMCMLSGCKNEGQETDEKQGIFYVSDEVVDTLSPDIAQGLNKEEEEVKDYSQYFQKMEIAKSFKKTIEGNPLITQSFGADPYAMVYEDTLYIYMTADQFEKTETGIIKENTYSKIQSIHVVSTKDMVNFTDHGEIKVAGEGGATKWAKNSWAPAAAWKMIDGKPRFFLYFADGGGGIGVLQSDSPTGPFVDPIGSGLVTRNTPNCANVLWLFDPAVLVDDDGRAYLYCGGGVPEGKAPEPGTGRVVELGDDMISLKGEPKELYAPYLFEDSGIHKFNNKYYYTYCSNFSVDQAGTDKFGFENGEIICMVSDSPMGPFKFQERILENPGKHFGLSGNNHHCVFNFQDQWYITYHTRVLEQNMGVEKGYRCTFIDKINMQDDGTIGTIEQTLTGCEQIKKVDAYSEQNASMIAAQGGISMIPVDEKTMKYGAGNFAIGDIASGEFTVVRGVDFGHKSAAEIQVTLRQIDKLNDDCVIQIRLDNFKGDVVGYIPVKELLEQEQADSHTICTVVSKLDANVNGVHDLYFVYSGCNYEVVTWKFLGDESNWYETMIQKSLISTGTNGRLEKVLAKLENGQHVNVAFIGGSVTEGAGAAKVSESYADQTAQYLKDTYPTADINYLNTGLGGTPSALGVMRYTRDVIDELGTTPDLLFLEFAVNDFEEQTSGRAYESMVRDIMEKNPETAVVLVFAVFKNKWNMQDTYIPVGEAYGLPMVTVKNPTDYAYEEKKFTVEDYFSDEFHPTTFGHTIMADSIAYMLQQVKADADSVIENLPEKAVIGLDFQKELLITSEDTKGAKIKKGAFDQKDKDVHAFFRNMKVSFPDNWMCDGTKNDEFEMELNCKNLLMNYKTSSDTNFGTACIYVDGKLVKEINSYLNTGWNNSNVVLLLDEKESNTHKITIKMKDAGKKFTVLAFGYSK